MSHAGSLIGALRVMLGMDTAEFEKGADSSTRRARRMEKDFAAFGKNLQSVGKTLSIAVSAPLGILGKSAMDAAIASRDAIGQVETALKSMGGASGKTSAELQKSAMALEKVSAFDDKEILRGVTANLLTFGNVAGAEFDRAQLAAVNLASRLGKDLQSSTLMVGKALNDPVKGLAALSEAGIQFTDDQKAMVTQMVETGNAAGAQGIILKELERQFNDAGKAARDAAPGSAATNAWSTLKETIGEQLLRVLDRLEPMLTTLLEGFNRLSPGVQQTIVGLGAAAVAIGPLTFALGTVLGPLAKGVTLFMNFKRAVDIAGIIKNIIPMIGALGKALLGLVTANPVLAGIALAVGGIFLAWQNWDKIKPIIDEVSAAVEGWYTENIKPTFDKVMAVLEPFITFFKDTFSAQIEGVLNVVSSLLKGDFSGAWTAAKEMASKMLNALLNLAGEVGPKVVGYMKDLYTGVKNWLQEKLGAVFKWVGDKLSWVGDKFYELYDSVVGHSYIPDMVDEIGQHIARLTGLMVEPVAKMTHQTGAAFASMADQVANENDQMADRIEVTAERVANSFKEMVEGITGALRGFVDAIKKGDVLGIVDGLLAVLESVGQAVGGFKIGPAVFGGAGGGGRPKGGGTHGGGQLPKFANGGAMRFGGLAGIDRNLLSLNGNPIARVSRGEVMQVNPANNNAGALKVTVTMDESTGALGAFVRDESGKVLAQAAPGLIRAGGQAGVKQMQQMQSRRLA